MEGTPDPGIDKVNVRVLPDGRMTRRDAARYLGYEPKTLAMWHLEGKGPRSVCPVTPIPDASARQTSRPHRLPPNQERDAR